MNQTTLPYQNGNHIVIYDASLAKKQPASQLKKRLGYTCLVFSLLTFLSLFFTPLILEARYQLHQPQQPNYFASYLNKDFKLIIPKINLNTNVTRSVNLTNETAWQTALKTNVAHAQNTAYPDESGTVYIFGHSTDYPWNIQAFNALFYSLNKLELNDQIIISYQKNIYNYQVKEKKILKADDLTYLTSTKNQLVLQTCWPPGTTWKRLVIIATPQGKPLTNQT